VGFAGKKRLEQRVAIDAGVQRFRESPAPGNAANAFKDSIIRHAKIVTSRMPTGGSLVVGVRNLHRSAQFANLLSDPYQ
jgi:hypothetical protein